MSGETRLSCSFCPQTFVCESHLEKHIYDYHEDFAFDFGVAGTYIVKRGADGRLHCDCAKATKKGMGHRRGMYNHHRCYLAKKLAANTSKPTNSNNNNNNMGGLVSATSANSNEGNVDSATELRDLNNCFFRTRRNYAIRGRVGTWIWFSLPARMRCVTLHSVQASFRKRFSWPLHEHTCRPT